LSKLLTLVLALAAFAVAAYLVLLKRPVPGLAGSRGLRRGFLLSVALFASLLTSLGCSDPWEGATCYWCYSTPEMERKWALERSQRKKALATLQEVWVTLDYSRKAEFHRLADEATGEGGIDDEVAPYLKTAFAELSYHKHRLLGIVSCYLPTDLGRNRKLWRERLMLQLRLLGEARREGVLDVGTIARIVAVMEVDLERLHWARTLEGEEGDPPSEASEEAGKAARRIEDFEYSSPPRE
jgi:hypothetical protein